VVLTPLLLWGLSCAPPPPPPAVTVDATGLHAHAEAGISRLVLWDPDGTAQVSRRLPAPVEDLGLTWIWPQDGTWTAELTLAEGQVVSVPLAVEVAQAPLVAWIQAPVGQEGAPLVEGQVVPLALVDGAPAQVGVTVTALRAGPARVVVGDQQQARSLQAGERLTLLASVSEPEEVVVEAGGGRIEGRLAPRRLASAELRAQLSLDAVDLPASPDGEPELGRPAGRVSLPARWWRGLLGTLGMGIRPRDPWAPWSHVGVALTNHGAEDLNVLIRLRVLDADGQPAPAFAPRLREGGDDSGVVRALLRVPAGRTARAALPLFVDEGRLSTRVGATQRWTRVVDVLPLGGSEALVEDRAPLFVSRGSTVASLGLVGALAAALGGSLMLVLRGATWLRQARTSELMTISLFGSLTFLVGAVGRLLTMGLATVLGPFASLLTGLVDDCLRYALLATLVSLLPRPGTASLAVLTGWLLAGFTMGTFSPTDLLFVGGRVLWLEGLLWLSGITRVPGWQDEGPFRRWLRLSLGFGGASVLASATGLVLHVTLYRLFLAPWYVALILALPGFAYIVLACGLAVPFADSLRRVQR